MGTPICCGQTMMRWDSTDGSFDSYYVCEKCGRTKEEK